MNITITKLVIMGSGVHAKMVASTVLKLKNFELIAFIDPHSAPGTTILERPVVPDFSAAKALASGGPLSFVVGIGNNARRRDVFLEAKEAGLQPAAIIDPSAIVNPRARIKEGAYLAPGCIVNIDAQIGENAIINTGAIVEHDNVIGAHTHIAPGVKLAGAVTVGELTFMGIGSVVIDKVRVGNNVMVGAGGVVIDDVPDGLTVVGVPAKRILKKV